MNQGEVLGKGKKGGILLLLLACFMTTFIVRYVWSPLIPTVSEEFGLTAVQAGAYMSAFYIGYVITQIPSGLLADRYNVRFILSGCIIGLGITTYLISMVNGYSVGFALRVVTGLFAGGVWACCARVIANYFSNEERGLAFGVVLAAPVMGIITAYNIGDYFNATIGWRAAFQVCGAIAIVIGILSGIFIKSKNVEVTKKQGFFDGLKRFATSKDLILLTLAGFMYMWVSTGTATWTFAYLFNIGLIEHGSAIITVYGIGAFIGGTCSGYIGDKLKISRKTFSIVGFLLIAITGVIFGSQTTVVGLYVWGTIFGMITFLPATHITALIVVRGGVENAAVSSGTSNFIFQFAGIAQPLIVGLVLDMTGVFTTVWYMFAACTVISALLVTGVSKDVRQ